MISSNDMRRRVAIIRAQRLARAVAAILSASTLAMPLLASAAEDAAESGATLDQVVVTGTRVADRARLDTLAPVDVVSGESLRNQGSTEVNQALSVALPSYNFPRPGLADGTDTIRPATLRGLAPDQTLVLVNSKRRHSSSLVNLNGTIGRGASAVDLNTIPNAIVQSIEVLRDGASAEYGSDAIAGVINLRLRENHDGGQAAVTYGWNDTTYETLTGTPPAGATWSAPSVLSRSVSDGETLTASVWKGFALGDSGFLTVAVEYKDQQHTERSGWDFRQQYPLVGTAFDPREATFNRFNGWYGEPELTQKTVFANGGYDFGDDTKMYGWVSWQDRDARSAGFYRPARDDRNVIQIYPDGFLPIIAPTVTDYSAALGLAWKLGEWSLDSSFVYGKNKMEFTIENTLNRSLGTASKTTFDAGGFEYEQLVYNFSAVRQVEVSFFHSPLNVATGLEARREGYLIFAGEPDSYRNGGVLLPLNTGGCVPPFTPSQVTAGGCATASGSQVFPGFRPSNEVDKHRTAVGAYLDLEANVTEKFLASVALRGEHYSDFGEDLSGKVAGRYDFMPSFAVRGSVQTGFRAPSLQQQYFATTSTNFINGVPFDITTFPVTDPVARALGATDLDAEKSTNFSVGTVIRFSNLNVTIDAYRIDIDNRIVLSENLTQANVRAYLAAQGFVGIGGGRFFINGVDTRTEGLDIVAQYVLPTQAAGKFDFTFTANFNSTDVLKVPQTVPLAALTPPPPLFDRINVLTFEEGNPKNKFGLSSNWSLGRLGATLRFTRYGEFLTPGTTAALDFWNDATLITDVEVRFNITDKLRFGVGADNVLDEYPDKLPPNLNTTGTTDFSNYSPFGRAGRFIYGRVSYDF
jgi:iron complex outermembrane receptor protein